MSLRTLNDVFFAVAERPHPRLMLQRRENVWEAVSSDSFSSGVRRVAEALRGWGIGKGDRVAILSENRPEWMMADFASLLLSAVSVPIYATLTAEQTSYILRDSGARVLFLSNETQLQKALSIREQTRVEQIVVFDSIEADAMKAPAARTSTLGIRQLWADTQSGIHPQLEANARAVTPDDLATIIYTSGTTGTPKGVMLTHGNVASNLTCSLSEFPVQANDVSISFLPLSHVTARHVDFALLYRGVTLAYVPFVDQLPRALQEVRPTFFVAVPRVYEKIRRQVIVKTADFPKNAIYRWALSVGHAYREET